MYANALKVYDTRHVAEAIREIGMAKRQEYETAFPELGAIIQKTEYLRDARKNKAAFVSCDDCFFGWLIVLRNGEFEASECDCLRRWRSGIQAPVPDPVLAHLAELSKHPERFVPVEFCMRVGEQLAKAKLERKKAVNPMSDAEYRTLKKKLTAEMNAAWMKQIEDERKVVA